MSKSTFFRSRFSRLLTIFLEWAGIYKEYRLEVLMSSDRQHFLYYRSPKKNQINLNLCSVGLGRLIYRLRSVFLVIRQLSCIIAHLK